MSGCTSCTLAPLVPPFPSDSRLLLSSFGEPFLRETFLYHLSRLDHRHNFSSYFYPFYLSSSPAASPASASLSLVQQFARSPLSAFVPQLVLSLGLGFLFGAQDLPFAWLVQTFAFVTLNKVCTSQVRRSPLFSCPSRARLTVELHMYACAVLPLVPLASSRRAPVALLHPPSRALHRLALGSEPGASFFYALVPLALTRLLPTVQALWLSQAFRLEMLGEPVYRHVWGTGIVFLFAQSWVLVELLRAYRPVQRRARESDQSRGKAELDGT